VSCLLYARLLLSVHIQADGVPRYEGIGHVGCRVVPDISPDRHGVIPGWKRSADEAVYRTFGRGCILRGGGEVIGCSKVQPMVKLLDADVQSFSLVCL